jgi:hypothetical protein
MKQKISITTNPQAMLAIKNEANLGYLLMMITRTVTKNKAVNTRVTNGM